MPSNRLLIGIAVVSVALNLLLVGVVLGRFAGPEPGAARIDPVVGMRRLIRNLPEERAETLAPYYRDYFSALRPRFRELRGAQRQIREAMITDPLDAGALRTAMESFQSQLSRSQAAAREAFISLAGALTLAERRALVDAMDDQRDRGERPFHHVPGPPPAPGHPPHAEWGAPP
ncbi:MAG: periplasmic heavy metal sensor [Pseudomonadales bacterium]|jgi:uncharacterized membrane protein